MEEEWRDVIGFEGHYQVSNKGNVRSMDRYVGYKIKGKIRIAKSAIKIPHINRGGYYQVNLFKDGKYKTKVVHRMVAEAFIENIGEKDQVNHIDGNKTNNNVENLEWCTNSENAFHSSHILKNGLQPINQYDLNGKFIASYEGIRDASAKTGVARCSISNVARGRRNKAGGFIWKYPAPLTKYKTRRSN